MSTSDLQPLFQGGRTEFHNRQSLCSAWRSAASTENAELICPRMGTWRNCLVELANYYPCLARLTRRRGEAQQLPRPFFRGTVAVSACNISGIGIDYGVDCPARKTPLLAALVDRISAPLTSGHPETA
jgi:hypothetical protein